MTAGLTRAVLAQLPPRIAPVVSAVAEAVPSDVWNLVEAGLVLLVGWYVSKLVVRSVGRMIARQFKRPSITQTVLRGIRVSVLLVAVAIAGRIVGFQPGNILLSVTVFSAVVAVILAPIVGSVISGLFVLADQPFEIGDMIELTDNNGGQKGFVEDITLRYTKMFTLDNTFIVVPNSTIRERDVVNYSAEDERTRQSLSVLVTYESDLAEARRLFERSARQVDNVIPGGPGIRVGSARYDAAPTCFIDEYADHGVLLTLRYWLQEPYKLLVARSQIQENLWEELDGADVEFAYPHSHLVFDETSGQANVSVSQQGGRMAATGRPADRDRAGGAGRQAVGPTRDVAETSDADSEATADHTEPEAPSDDADSNAQ
ncbi:Small-conductance mechanosensitive channel [Natronoarchaeum philippinense]|uniref:Small-conductance mechanosensitive channel n=1 Tax=Natronoarchaeum philippinense TaxID=558529 RepID=A0A285N493_NATPI|nr:mechanosensitive ion channel family protein [Natronoarchaeum philippinense]SNZ04295.1 Small-conductance mechanosensitive channel [Natronoarchaeum philippinense]